MSRIHYFHITGFGRFAGLDANPAKFTVEKFHDHIKSLSNPLDEGDVTLQIPSLHQKSRNYTTLFVDLIKQSNSSNDLGNFEGNLHVFCNTTILQVDVETVEEYFALKFREIENINQELIDKYSKLGQSPENIVADDQTHNKSVISTADSQSSLLSGQYNPTTQTLSFVTPNCNIYHHFIHVGVHGGSKCVAMEEYAYNNATFRCDDEKRYAPFCTPIRKFDLKSRQILCQVLQTRPNFGNKAPNEQIALVENDNNDNYRNGQNRSSSNNNNNNEGIQSQFFISPQPVVESSSCSFTGFADIYTPQDLGFDSVLQTQLNLNLVYPMLLQYHSNMASSSLSSVPQSSRQNQSSADDDYKSEYFEGNNGNAPICVKKAAAVAPPPPSPPPPPISITNDPGGFVCNYIYFVSLYYSHFLFPYLNKPSQLARHGVKVWFSSLFYHIPLETISSIENNINVLLSTIAAILHVDAQHSELMKNNNGNCAKNGTICNADESQHLVVENDITHGEFEGVMYTQCGTRVMKIKPSSAPQCSNGNESMQSRSHSSKNKLNSSPSPTIGAKVVNVLEYDELKHVSICGGRLPRQTTLNSAEKRKFGQQQRHNNNNNHNSPNFNYQSYIHHYINHNTNSNNNNNGNYNGNNNHNHSNKDPIFNQIGQDIEAFLPPKE
jgi:pyrrolidone-carboxylate peptidase